MITWRFPVATAATAVALTALVPSAALAQNAYTSILVNLRAGPELDYPIVATYPAGVPMQVEGCQSDYRWCDVLIEGERGWMAADYITYSYENQAVPLFDYGPSLGLPIVSFAFGPYWDNYYRGRPFYYARNRWEGHPSYIYRPPPPPRPFPGGRPPPFARPGGPGFGPGPGRPYDGPRPGGYPGGDRNPGRAAEMPNAPAQPGGGGFRGGNPGFQGGGRPPQAGAPAVAPAVAPAPAAVPVQRQNGQVPAMRGNPGMRQGGGGTPGGGAGGTPGGGGGGGGGAPGGHPGGGQGGGHPGGQPGGGEHGPR